MLNLLNEKVPNGFNAARGFVGGAASMVLTWSLGQFRFNAARGFVGGAALRYQSAYFPQPVSMPHAALWVVQPSIGSKDFLVGGSFNAARGFVGGAARRKIFHGTGALVFQCRTRLCGWCSPSGSSHSPPRCAVTMPHAALWVVQLIAELRI